MHQTELYHIEWDLCCASQQTWPLDFRSGSQADISLRPTNVRFSNRPVWVKRFQTIHQNSFEV
ncbi:MAG: hypothetical protein WAK04_06250, partial [Xanthobacteraceae bacterium]